MVDNVNSLTNSATNNIAANTNAAQKSVADQQTFLNLLMIQLKTQDPSAPTDPGEFLAQLASFSSVEQQLKTNENLEALLSAGQAGQAADIIGATVSSKDGSIQGVVRSATLSDDGVIANLENGQTLLMESGIKILSKPA